MAEPVIISVLALMGIGATCGLVLSVASKVFYVYEDPRIAEVEYFFAGVQWLELHKTPVADRAAALARALKAV